MTTDIQLTHDQGIVTLTLDRPDSLNSLSLGAIKSLLHELRTLRGDPSVNALIITGAGRAFCAGWQLDEGGIPGLPDESFGVRQAHLMAEYFNPVIQTMSDLPFPTLAAVNGVCAGAGVSLALAADIVIAADTASFVLTFSPKLGLIPDLGATWKLPRLIGWARAQAVTMLGDRISANEALQWGMIWKSVPSAELGRCTRQVADRLSQGPRGICREVRQAYHAAQTQSLEAQMEFERLRQRDLLDRPSFAEGLRAFQEKRAPDFRRGRP